MDIDKLTEYYTSDETKDEATRWLNVQSALRRHLNETKSIEVDAFARYAEAVAKKYGRNAQEMSVEALAELIAHHQLEERERMNE